jgi:hypothetical protein
VLVLQVAFELLALPHLLLLLLLLLGTHLDLFSGFAMNCWCVMGVNPAHDTQHSSGMPAVAVRDACQPGQECQQQLTGSC